MNLLRFGRVRAQSSIATVPMTLTSMIRPGFSASGSRLASVAVPRDRGVTVAPWTMCVTAWPASAARQVPGCVTSPSTTDRRFLNGAK